MRILSIAQNVPGPVAVARLVADGAEAIKIEPPWGDQLETLCKPWYAELHARVRVERLDLKTPEGAARAWSILDGCDVFLASQRPSALTRLGLDAAAIRKRGLTSLCHVNIVGDTANPEEPGHDITYQARAGLLAVLSGVEGQQPLPLTLLADMAGAERAYGVIRDAASRPGESRVVGLYNALRDLAEPLRRGLTAPGGPLGGSNPAYAVYQCRAGWIALGALEPHFRARLFEGLGLADGADPSHVFFTRTAAEWEQWAAARDLPLVAIKRS